MDLRGIFPTPIGLFEQTNLSDDLYSFLNGHERKTNLGHEKSVETYLLDKKELHLLRQYIERCVNQYFIEVFRPSTDVKLRITQSWMNWYKPGDFHHAHSHSNSFVSGTLYLKANKETDRVIFETGGYEPLTFVPTDWNQFNTHSWSFPVGTGEMILFPSSIFHRVAPVEGTEDRISLSFNTFPVGDIGDDPGFSGLKL